LAMLLYDNDCDTRRNFVAEAEHFLYKYHT